MTDYYENLLREWLANPWLSHGVGAYISSNIGHLVPVLVLELIVQQSWAQGSMISYGSLDRRSRKDALSETHKKKGFSFWEQVRNCMWNTMGPFGIGCALLAAVVHMNDPAPETLFPTMWEFVTQLVMMELVGDFFLYWGHRVQHTNKWLWENCHYYHHTIDTPSPTSAICINPIDAFLQGSLPLGLAGAIVLPHPLTGYVYNILRIGENVVNHSGLDSRVLDFFTLKFLPLRAAVMHHDSHHKLSNHDGGAKNYGENFWIWDYIFSTYRNPATIGKTKKDC
eukprot:TRINITY_DN8821_c0_g1_i2.p1 TRINITY_DN8821_c0_g1~~TRINITY_DN8821_c0_g1_i2.p1  ORF type:complete len:304 (+),score=76.65 TRINITY_DN8821_c0_g1_i2:68-913(+)